MGGARLTGFRPSALLQSCGRMAVRLRRILLRVALAAVGSVVLALLAAVLVLENLDHPWVKRRIAAAAGFELDYRALELVGVSGLHLEQLVVLNPPSVRATARELLRLESLDVSW